MEYDPTQTQQRPERQSSSSPISPTSRVETPIQTVVTPTTPFLSVPRPTSSTHGELNLIDPPRETTGSPALWPLRRENDAEVRTVGSDSNASPPLPQLPEEIPPRDPLEFHPDPRAIPLDLNSRRTSTRQHSHVDWLVPLDRVRPL